MHYLKFLTLAFLVSIMVISCATETKKEPEFTPVNLPKEKAPTEVGYYCPMKCEGEKVYPDDRNPCPVCDMKLVHTK